MNTPQSKLSNQDHNEIITILRQTLLKSVSSYQPDDAEDSVQDLLLASLTQPSLQRFILKNCDEIRRKKLPGKLRIQIKRYAECCRRKRVPYRMSNDPERTAGFMESAREVEGEDTVIHLRRNFSPRQKRILRLRMCGFTCQEIAQKLRVCLKTVHNDIRIIRQFPAVVALWEEYHRKGGSTARVLQDNKD